MTTLTDQLLLVADHYGRATQRSRARVSTLLFNDGKRLGRIAVGGDLGTRSFEAAMAWLSGRWPDGVDWPVEVPRPVAEVHEEAA